MVLEDVCMSLSAGGTIGALLLFALRFTKQLWMYLPAIKLFAIEF